MTRNLSAFYGGLARICSADICSNPQSVGRINSFSTAFLPLVEANKVNHLRYNDAGRSEAFTWRPFASASQKDRSADRQLFADLQKKMQQARKNNDFARIERMIAVWVSFGHVPELWMAKFLIQTYGFHRDPAAAFAATKRLQQQGLAPDGMIYYQLIQACSRAQKEPYQLDRQHAERAQRILREALEAGVECAESMWSALMEVQAKAAMADEAAETFARARAAGIRPSVRMHNILANAYSRAGRPVDAERVLLQDMPTDGLQPDIVTWNSVLRAYGSVSDVDGAYRIWEGLQAAEDVVPDDFTQIHLARAFATNPRLAAELVAEAARLEKGAVLEPDTAAKSRAGTQRPPQAEQLSMEPDAAAETLPAALTERIIRQPLQQPLVVAAAASDDSSPADAAPQEPLRSLDLHGMAIATARVALLQWLNQIVAWEQHRHSRQAAGGGESQTLLASIAAEPAKSDASFVVITGKGLRSNPRIGGVLGDVTEDLLRRQQLPFDASRPGQLTIAADEMANWARRQREAADKLSFMHRISLRTMFVFGGAVSILAAATLVPELLSIR